MLESPPVAASRRAMQPPPYNPWQVEQLLDPREPQVASPPITPKPSEVPPPRRRRVMLPPEPSEPLGPSEPVVVASSPAGPTGPVGAATGNTGPLMSARERLTTRLQSLRKQRGGANRAAAPPIASASTADGGAGAVAEASALRARADSCLRELKAQSGTPVAAATQSSQVLVRGYARHLTPAQQVVFHELLLEQVPPEYRRALAAVLPAPSAAAKRAALVARLAAAGLSVGAHAVVAAEPLPTATPP
jgi:hypothetical protein